MFKKLIVVSLSFLVSSAYAMEEGKKEANFSHKEYTQEELVATRIAWAGQENRLGQLKYEASDIASNRVADYFSGGKYVAAIDANNKTIATAIPQGKKVTLSYEDFSTLLRDKTIVDLANKRLEEERFQIKFAKTNLHKERISSSSANSNAPSQNTTIFSWLSGWFKK